MLSLNTDPTTFTDPTSRQLRVESAIQAAAWIAALSDEQVAGIGGVTVAAMATLDNEGVTALSESLFDAGLDRTADLADADGLIDAAATARAERAAQL